MTIYRLRELYDFAQDTNGTKTIQSSIAANKLNWMIGRIEGEAFYYFPGANHFTERRDVRLARYIGKG